MDIVQRPTASTKGSDSRIPAVNTGFSYFWGFCEIIGIVAIVAIVVAIWMHGLDFLSIWFKVVNIGLSAILALAAWSCFKKFLYLQGELNDLEAENQAVQNEQERLKVEWERLKLEKQELKMKELYSQGVVTEKKMGDYDPYTDENGVTKTTVAEQVEVVVDYGEVYTSLKNQARSELRGGNWWDENKWKEYTKSPYQTIKINGKNGAIKWLAFNHLKARKAQHKNIVFNP